MPLVYPSPGNWKRNYVHMCARCGTVQTSTTARSSTPTYGVHGTGPWNKMKMIRGSRPCLIRVAFAATIAAATLGGCGGNREQYALVVVGHGRTAAGAAFVATLRPTKECPLGLRVVEAGIARALCYSIFEEPVRPKIECLPEGRLVLHWRVAPTAHSVQLTLSDGHRITSSVMRVASGVGGPAGLYYQAVRGPAPIPVDVREIGGASQTMSVRRLVECTAVLVKHVGRNEGQSFAEIPTPHGIMSISNRVDRLHGKDYPGLRAVLGPMQIIVGSGALRLLLPLRWEARRICRGSSPFTILYGVVEGRGYRVLVRSNGRLYALRAKPVPRWVGLQGTLVYGIWRDVPDELIVRTSSAKVVETMGIGNLIAQTPCL
jgi:hypothetical protein